MSRTAWYKSCGAIALAAVFALNSTPLKSETIQAGQTIDGAEGTSSNPLKIYGTANNSVINSGTNYVYSGGTANNTTINDGSLSVSGTANNTIVDGGKISGSGIIDGLAINENGSFSKRKAYIK